MKTAIFFLIFLMFGCNAKPVAPETQLEEVSLPNSPTSVSLVDESTGNLRWFMPGGPIFEFVRAPAGTFMMGAGTEGSPPSLPREGPLHKVAISRDYYIGKYEVTTRQWTWIMGQTSIFDPNRQVYTEAEFPNHPIQKIELREVKAFIDSLNKKEGRLSFRLPTEAEWEYACRAGTSGPYWFGSSYNHRQNHENLDWAPGSIGRTIIDPIGPPSRTDKAQRIGWTVPNPWGIYDMYGNVAEWILEGEFRLYTAEPQIDPIGPTTNGIFTLEILDRTLTYTDIHLIRGGAYNLPEHHTSAYYRGFVNDVGNGPKDGVGFRLVRSITDRE